VTLPLQGPDHVEGKEHHRAMGPAVIPQVGLVVAVEAMLGDERFENARLRHAAPGDVHRLDAWGIHRKAS
jgi:hypothetical protein